MRVFGHDITGSGAVAALAVGLLVIGAGAAVGMGGGGGGGGGGHHAVSVRRDAGPPAAPGPASTATAPAPTAAPSTTAVTRSRPVPVEPAPAAAPRVAAGHGQAGGTSSSPGSSPTSAPVGYDRVVTSGPGTPPPGTYTYDTSGSSTLFSKTTPYPSKTTIAVTRQGCGVSAKWTSSPGNSTTVYECPVTGGVHVVSETSTVNTGGYQQTVTFDCDADSFVPTSGTPGQTWTWSCHSSNGETSTQVVKLIGPATMTVGGAPVATEHVHVVSTLSGPQQGTVTTDYWLTPNATPVREVGSIEASQYGVTYQSNYTLQLESLTPAP